MIQVTGLTKKYGDKQALSDVSFHVERGEIIGLLGLNGAGKSTMMNIITGYIGATKGTVSIDGFDVFRDPLETKKRIGYLPEQFVFYNDMRVSEYLDFICDLKKVVKNRKEQIDAICEKVGIASIKGRMVRNLSKGYRQRVGLAQALIGSPQVLILDEPTVGLDPSQVVEIRALIRELGKTSTVIISSHILSEIQNICTRIIMLHGGKLVADSPTESLTRQVDTRSRVVASIAGEPVLVAQTLGGIDGLREVLDRGEKEPGVHEYAIESADGRDIRAEVFRALAKADLPLLATASERLSLENTFLRMIGSQDAAHLSENAGKGGVDHAGNL